MNNYISLKAVLSQIPKPLLEHSDEADFLSWALNGLRESNVVQMYEPKIKIFEIIDGKVNLPEEIKEINLVTYLKNKPTQEDISSFSNCITPCEDNQTISNESDTNNICNYTIAYKMFLDSSYYNNNYIPLQYRGNGSFLCKNCPNKFSSCQHIYTVDSTKTLHTDLNSGFLCIDYDVETKDINGDILIPDFQEMKQFLVFYCIAKHWEERAMMSEQNANNMAQDYLIKAEIYLKKIKGKMKLRLLNANSIALLQGGQYQKLIKLPSEYVFSR